MSLDVRSEHLISSLVERLDKNKVLVHNTNGTWVIENTWVRGCSGLIDFGGAVECLESLFEGEALREMVVVVWI